MIAGIDIDAKGAVAYGDHTKRLQERPIPVDDPDQVDALCGELAAGGVWVAYVETQLLAANVVQGKRGVATQGARHARIRDALRRHGIKVVDVDAAAWQRAIGVRHAGRHGLTSSQRRSDTKKQLKRIVVAVSGQAKWGNYDAVGIAIYAIGMRRFTGIEGA